MQPIGEYYCTECGWLNRNEVEDAPVKATCIYCRQHTSSWMEPDIPEGEKNA